MLRSTGTDLHEQFRSCGHLSRKGEALLRLILLLLDLAAPAEDSGRNLDPNG